jgi:hypothetical protein
MQAKLSRSWPTTWAAKLTGFYVWIRQISPMIWRRLLVGSYSSIADLHHTLQIAFGWSDYHLHRFHIHAVPWHSCRAPVATDADASLERRRSA